jgi:putative ABC transport system substrate-binding protein
MSISPFDPTETLATPNDNTTILWMQVFCPIKVPVLAAKMPSLEGWVGMQRRDFIVLLGVAAAWPVAARAQQPERMQRIGVLMGYDENDPRAQSLLSAFKQELAALGWIEDRNLRIDYRWAAGDVNRAGAFAKELVALQPKVILSNTTPVTAALHRETKTIPLVFVVVSDPVGSGFVESLPRPGGNVTGFVNLEASLVEKWLQLLKEIAPRATRVGVMFNPQTASYAQYYLQPLEAVASKFDVKVFAAPVRSESDIGTVITQLGREPGGGLIVMTDSFNYVHRNSIIALTRQNNVPAIDYQPAEGGLISYGVDTFDLFRRAAGYVDRILRGTKPAELPVQLPIKFQLVVNLKTAKALGLEVPLQLQQRADEVIE